jgi:hypothetical protein
VDDFGRYLGCLLNSLIAAAIGFFLVAVILAALIIAGVL